MYTNYHAGTIYKAYKQGKITMTKAQTKMLYDEVNRNYNVFVEAGNIRYIAALIREENPDWEKIQQLIDCSIRIPSED